MNFVLVLCCIAACGIVIADDRKLATTTQPTPIAAYNSNYNANSNYYGRYNPLTGRYEKSYDSGQYQPYAERNNENYYGRYNPRTGLYDNNRQYNPYTGRYEYNNNYNYNGRYNQLTGRYENWQNDQYYDNRNVGPKYVHPSYYGIGSVERVHVPKVRYNNEGHWNTLRDVRRSNEDSYHYSYETENGIRAAEDAHLENKNINAGTMKKSGFYEYQGDDGKTYRVDYVADENGYRAQGAHLPTPPPIPDYIQRSLDYIASKRKSSNKI